MKGRNAVNQSSQSHTISCLILMLISCVCFLNKILVIGNSYSFKQSRKISRIPNGEQVLTVFGKSHLAVVQNI